MNVFVAGWIVVGIAAWCVTAVAVGILISRAVRLRDRQVPRPPRPTTGIPAPRAPADRALDRDRPATGR